MFQHDEFIGCDEIEINQMNGEILRNIMNPSEHTLESFGIVIKQHRKFAEALIYPFHVTGPIWMSSIERIGISLGINKEREFTSIKQTAQEFVDIFIELHCRYAGISSKAVSVWHSGKGMLQKNSAFWTSTSMIPSKSCRRRAWCSTWCMSPFAYTSTTITFCHAPSTSVQILLMSAQKFAGMIPKLFQDDRIFFSNFSKSSTSSIRSWRFKIFKMWRRGETAKGRKAALDGKQSHFIGLQNFFKLIHKILQMEMPKALEVSFWKISQKARSLNAFKIMRQLVVWVW